MQTKKYQEIYAITFYSFFLFSGNNIYPPQELRYILSIVEVPSRILPVPRRVAGFRHDMIKSTNEPICLSSVGYFYPQVNKLHWYIMVLIKKGGLKNFDKKTIISLGQGRIPNWWRKFRLRQKGPDPPNTQP
jgi:hypothetical protein